MSTTPSLRPMFAFPGWIIDNIDIDWGDLLAAVYLRRDGRIQHFKCSHCHTPMGKMRTQERTVLDLPLGTLKVQLRFTVFQGRCSQCRHFETVTPPGLVSQRTSNRSLETACQPSVPVYALQQGSRVHSYLASYCTTLGQRDAPEDLACS